MATSRCSSPMPLRISSFVSGSTRVRKVGSSRTILPSASASLVSSTFLAGVMDWAMTGSGKRISSSEIGRSLSHKVLPVDVWRRPTTATISPGPPFERGGEVIGYRIEQQPDAVELLGRATVNRHQFAIKCAGAERAAQHLLGDWLAFNDVFEQGVAAVRRRF